MSRFAELETFVAVVETGSFSAASKRLGLAISAVSRRVSELETRLGVRLANRSTRGFAVTSVGRAYYEKAIAILADMAEADASVTGDEAAMSGVVRIAAPLSFGVKHLGPILHQYAEERPLLRFDIDLSDRRVDLIEEGFDLAIRIGSLQDSSLIAKKLFPIHHVVAASPDFWKEHGTPKQPRDLEGLPAITYRIGSDPSSWFYQDSQGRRGKINVVPRYTVTNGDFAVQAAVKSLGIILEPTFVCVDQILNGSLQPVLPDYKWFDMSAYAIWPPGRPLPQRVKNLVDHLADTLAEPTPWDTSLDNV